jgi:hypothetical protein
MVTKEEKQEALRVASEEHILAQVLQAEAQGRVDADVQAIVERLGPLLEASEGAMMGSYESGGTAGRALRFYLEEGRGSESLKGLVEEMEDVLEEL